MKQGHKYLYANGRGNYSPVSLSTRNWVKQAKKRLAENNYGKGNTKLWDEQLINAQRHGIGLRSLRKGLSSKLRHMAKREIQNELNSI